MGSSCCIGDCCVMDNRIGNFFRDLFGGSSCGYYPSQSATEAHAEKIANELAEMNEQVKNSSMKAEEDIISYINRSTDNLLTELDKLGKREFGGKRLNLDIAEIRAENARMTNDVKGSVSRVMTDRLVETDPELSAILAEQDDKKRKKLFDEFVNRVQKTAILNLRDAIEKTVKAQSAMVEKVILDRVSEAEDGLKRATESYERALQSVRKGKEAAWQDQIDNMYLYELSDTLIRECQ